ncbi:hypothetical protein N8K70_16575 [Microbacterium betulae]|uniref:Fructose-bisphosphate aldolase n=1 Tax=Microbacterium betulae TaxID=2981139 RepID=A0AA97FK49_9MICO|nr:hypothetical protein [Microbacterium sp. AB]WOF22987.1 hypothetical protein N8K70_16575 [Microbacterium sp. AB]
MNGCAIRTMSLLAPSGRSVMVAFDHGGGGAPEGGEDVPGILDTLGASSAQGLLLGPGLSRAAGPRLIRPGAPALVTALDAPIFSDTPGGHGPLLAHRRALSPATALGQGATSGKVVLPIAVGDAAAHADSVAMIAALAEEAHAVGLPLMIEPALWGADARHDDAVIAHSARVAWELGADSVKIHAPHDHDVLAGIVAHAVGPVFVLGGSPASAEGFVRDVDAWIAAGATGVVVGRNVWARPDPAAAISALARVVHDRDPDGAREILTDAERAASRGAVR